MQIKLGDREYEVKYPFAACREIERASGRSITTFAFETINRATSGDVSFDDITLLVWGGILHVRRNISLDQVAIQLEGLADDKPLLNVFVDCAAELRKSLDAKLKFEEPTAEEKN
ncbi:MAG: hypothetical protein RRY12_11940 [Cloacibacillus sp.]